MEVMDSLEEGLSFKFNNNNSNNNNNNDSDDDDTGTKMGQGSGQGCYLSRLDCPGMPPTQQAV